MCECGLFRIAFLTPHTKYTRPKAIKSHAAIFPLTSSMIRIFPTAIPRDAPIKPITTELPTWPIPHKTVMKAVFNDDQPLAFEITINGR
jgi:hypothetical protein